MKTILKNIRRPERKLPRTCLRCKKFRVLPDGFTCRRCSGR